MNYGHSLDDSELQAPSSSDPPLTHYTVQSMLSSFHRSHQSSGPPSRGRGRGFPLVATVAPPIALLLLDLILQRTFPSMTAETMKHLSGNLRCLLPCFEAWRRHYHVNNVSMAAWKALFSMLIKSLESSDVDEESSVPLINAGITGFVAGSFLKRLYVGRR